MHQTGSFKSQDGLEFFEQSWLPEGEPKADLILLHGYGDHSTRYAHVAEAFNDAGIAVYALDQRGHGHSPGRRGYIGQYTQMLDDIDAFLDHIQPRLTAPSRFMMGHSMGGQLMTRYLQTRKPELTGALFSSPFLAFPDHVPRILIALSQVIGRLLPWLPVEKVDNTGLSRDPEVVEATDADPLSYHGKVHARTGMQFGCAMNDARQAFDAITLPAFITHGSDDRVVSPAGSYMLYENMASEDKTLRIYDGGYHELWNDLERGDVIQDMVKWVVNHL